jgi:hypothetical protein
MLIGLLQLSKVVPKTIHLVETLQGLLGIPCMYFDNQYSTLAATNAALFNLHQSYEPPAKLFASRARSGGEFDELLEKTMTELRE